MAIAWVAGNRGFHAGGATSLSTGSIALSGTQAFLRAFAFIGTGGTPADPTSVVWDSAGVNESLTSYQAGTTFATNFRANPWHKVGPTVKTAVVTATWAASHDETMLLADGYSGVDQVTTTRTATTPATGSASANPTTATMSVTSVSGDTVVGSAAFGCPSGGVTTITSATLTVREKVEGADIGGFEACAQGDTTASGTSTTASAALAQSGSALITWYIYGVALIPGSNDPAVGTLTLTGYAPTVTGGEVPPAPGLFTVAAPLIWR